MPEWFILLSLFLFGSAVGSFLNVCILRMPKEMSIAYPASHCPVCKKPIPFYFNIPLISYIILGGKCRNCKTPISFQYFFVELITPLTAVLLYFFFGLSLPLLLSFIFSAALIVITFIDLEHQIIPDRISLPGIIICFIFLFCAMGNTFKLCYRHTCRRRHTLYLCCRLSSSDKKGRHGGR